MHIHIHTQQYIIPVWWMNIALMRNCQTPSVYTAYILYTHTHIGLRARIYVYIVSYEHHTKKLGTHSAKIDSFMNDDCTQNDTSQHQIVTQIQCTKHSISLFHNNHELFSMRNQRIFGILLTRFTASSFSPSAILLESSNPSVSLGLYADVVVE